MLNLLTHTRNALKSQERQALTEALISLARSASLSGVSLFWALAIGYSGGKGYPTIRNLTIGLWAASSTMAALSIMDTSNDVADFLALNSSRLRGNWRSQALEAEMTRYTQQYTLVTQHQDFPALVGTSEPVAALPDSAVVQLPESLSPSELAQNLKSTIIVGQPGAGKGALVFAAIGTLKQSQPDLSIWAVTVKDDPEELKRWEQCDELYSDPLPAFLGVEALDDWQSGLDDFLARFSQHQGSKLLILDEALAVKEKTGQWFKGLMANLNHLASTGRSTRCYAWLMSQTPNASDFGISGGARNVFRRVMIVDRGDQGLLLTKTTFCGLPENSELLFSHSRSGRIVFDSLRGCWTTLEPIQIAIGGGTSRRAGLERSLLGSELLEYLEGRDPMKAHVMYSNWGKRRLPDTRALVSLLNSLERQGLVWESQDGWELVNTEDGRNPDSDSPDSPD